MLIERCVDHLPTFLYLLNAGSIGCIGKSLSTGTSDQAWQALRNREKHQYLVERLNQQEESWQMTVVKLLHNWSLRGNNLLALPITSLPLQFNTLQYERTDTVPYAVPHMVA